MALHGQGSDDVVWSRLEAFHTGDTAMERHGEEVHITTDEARGGSTPHIMRYVLAISLVLAIIALSLTWMIGAAYA